MARIFAALAIVALVGCGATKVVGRERVKTITLTSILEPTQTVRPPPPQPTVYVASNEGVLYKPRKMSYYGGAQVVERIRWMSYGGPTAVARAVYAYDTCKLGCGGGPYTYTPITLKLLNRESCRGSTAYTEWSIIGVRGIDPSPVPIYANSNPCGSP